MMRIFNSRRSMVGIFAITALVAIALINGTDTSTAIASIAVAVAGANAAQNYAGGRSERHIDDTAE